MSQTLIPKLADDRSTSKSADSHTISAPNELANVSQEPANPTGGTQAASHILATGSVVKTEPFPASVHGVSSAGLNLQQSNTQKPLDKRGVSITSTPQTIAQPNAHAHSAGQITASQPLPPGSIAPGQPLPVGGQAVAPQQPNGVLQGQLGQLPKPSIPSHLQNRVAAGSQPHLGGLQSRASGIVHQNGQPVQPMHAVGGQAMQTQPNGVKPGKIVSINDIQRVQNYIEKCLQLYLSQKEVVQQLEQQCQIEPCFTQLVWQKLEEQNQEFFRAYYTRLKLKDQIVLFNHLLDEQVKMLSRMPRPASGHTLPTSNAMMQPVVSAPSHQYPQQRLGAPVQVASSQPLPTSQAMPAPFPAEAPGNHQGAQAASSQPIAAPEFNSIGLDTNTTDNPHDLSHGHGLHFSESELNLAGMDGLGKGLMGVNDHDLAHIPRNFSLTDLGLDTDHGGLPRNISFPDFPALDLDSGGEHG